MVIDVNVITTGWTITGVIASFLVAVVALGLGASSFIQTKNLQKKERRERLLNEIIEWAEEIHKCRVERDESIRNLKSRYFDKIIESNIRMKLEDILHKEGIVTENIELGESILSFAAMRGKTCYIVKIAQTFGQNLQNAVMKLDSDIKEHIDLLEKVLKDRGSSIENILENIKEDDSNYIDDIGNHMKQLKQSAEKVIEEAAKLKAQMV